MCLKWFPTNTIALKCSVYIQQIMPSTTVSILCDWRSWNLRYFYLRGWHSPNNVRFLFYVQSSFSFKLKQYILLDLYRSLAQQIVLTLGMVVVSVSKALISSSPFFMVVSSFLPSITRVGSLVYWFVLAYIIAINLIGFKAFAIRQDTEAQLRRLVVCDGLVGWTLFSGTSVLWITCSVTVGILFTTVIANPRQLTDELLWYFFNHERCSPMLSLFKVTTLKCMGFHLFFKKRWLHDCSYFPFGHDS